MIIDVDLEKLVEGVSQKKRSYDISKELGIAIGTFYKNLSKAVDIGLISEHKRDEYAAFMQLSNFKNKDTYVKDVASMILKGFLRKDIRKKLDLGRKKFTEIVRHAIKLKLLPSEKYDFYNEYISRKSALLSTEKNSLQNIVDDALIKKLPNHIIMKIYKIKYHRTLKNYFSIAQNDGLMNKDQLSYLLDNANKRNVDYIKDHPEIYGDNHFSERAKKFVGMDLERFKKAGSIGGKASWKKNHENIQKNLDAGRTQYGVNKQYYGDIEFMSRGERLVGVLLLEMGIMNEIKKGDNFQKRIGNGIADFYISPKLIIEYHPLPTQRGLHTYENIDEYIENRKSKFGDEFKGKIICITESKKTKLYKQMQQLDKTITWANYRQAYESVQKKIAKEDEIFDFPKVEYEKEEKPALTYEVPF